MDKLYKPIYPVRGFNQSPAYKNSYNKDSYFSVIVQSFGQNLNPIYASMGLKGHNGLDIPCQRKTPVFASHDGKIVRIQDKLSYGLGVTIQSLDASFVTIYWHLDSFNVQVGQLVKVYDLIGYADSTGQSTGDHLHFGLYPANEPKNNGYDGATDPLPYIIEKPIFTFNNNLFIGMKGDDVKNLQIALANEGFLGQVDFAGFTGFFGTQTFDAVQRFQRKYGIMSTGFCGSQTRQKLNELYN